MKAQYVTYLYRRILRPTLQPRSRQFTDHRLQVLWNRCSFRQCLRIILYILLRPAMFLLGIQRIELVNVPMEASIR